MANISKIKAVELILKEVDKGTTFTDAFQVISSKHKLNEATFSKYWKEAKAKYEARQNKVEQAKTNHEIQRAIHELETKDGQVNDLIRQLNEVRQEIESGLTVEWTWLRDQYIDTVRPMNAVEKKDRRILYAKLLADIRQIRGLNAPKESNVKVETDIDKLFKTGDAQFAEDPIIEKTFKNLKGS